MQPQLQDYAVDLANTKMDEQCRHELPGQPQSNLESVGGKRSVRFDGNSQGS